MSIDCIKQWVNAILPEWKFPGHWSHKEDKELMSCLGGIRDLTEGQRGDVEEFVRAKSKADMWPRSRSEFLYRFSDIVQDCVRWVGKGRPALKKRGGAKRVGP